MIKVALEGAEFYAYHGFYPEEQLIGTRFVVNVQAAFTPQAALHEDNLNNTVNYEVLYAIIAEEMKQPRKLIETVAQAIINRLITEFAFVDTAEVTIKKLNLPFKGPVKNSKITVSYQK